MSQALVINAVTDEVLLFSLERPCTWKHKLFPAVVKKTFSIFYCRSIVKLRSWSPRWSIRRGRLHEEDGKMDSDIKVKQWGKISVVSSPCVMSWPTTHCTALLRRAGDWDFWKVCSWLKVDHSVRWRILSILPLFSFFYENVKMRWESQAQYVRKS